MDRLELPGRSRVNVLVDPLRGEVGGDPAPPPAPCRPTWAGVEKGRTIWPPHTLPAMGGDNTGWYMQKNGSGSQQGGSELKKTGLSTHLGGAGMGGGGVGAGGGRLGARAWPPTTPGDNFRGITRPGRGASIWARAQPPSRRGWLARPAARGVTAVWPAGAELLDKN